jgi:hypothetical protein
VKIFSPPNGQYRCAKATQRKTGRRSSPSNRSDMDAVLKVHRAEPSAPDLFYSPFSRPLIGLLD